MKYEQVIVKKRMKEIGITGELVNLKKGTICELYNNNVIFYNGKYITNFNSQNGYEYFWGYDPANPEKEISRQKTYDKLNKMAPPGELCELNCGYNNWYLFGEFKPGPAGWIWEWKEAVKDFSEDRLNFLIKCIEEDKNCSPLHKVPEDYKEKAKQMEEKLNEDTNDIVSKFYV